jgi:membrane associated rhomboid family serine protease
MDDMTESGGAGEGVAEERPREPIFNMPPVVVSLIGVCVGVHLVRLYGLSAEEDFWLLIYAAFIPIRYSGQFNLDISAFTSPFTYAFLHGSIVHLAVNMIWLAAFGTPLANRLGPLRFLLFWAATGVAAVALHYGLHHLDQTPLIGASGAISGMMGAAARFGFVVDRRSGRPAFDGPLLPVPAVLRLRTVVVFLAVWFAINIFTGLVGFGPGVSDSIAWEAHIGGFAAGFFGIGYFVGPHRPAPDPALTSDEEAPSPYDTDR